VLAYDGDDAVELVCGGEPVDVIGRIGEDPGDFWGEAPTKTQDATLRRHCDVEAGDPDGRDPFDPAEEWEGLPRNSFGDLGQWHCLE